MPINDDNNPKSTKARPYADPLSPDFDITIDQPGQVPAVTGKPSNTSNKSSSSSSQGATSSPDLKRASSSDTRARVSNIGSSDAMRDMMNRMQDIDTSDEISDAEAAINAGRDAHPVPDLEIDPLTARRVLPEFDRIPTLIRNDLAVLNKDLVDDRSIIPDWHAIPNLPGYMQRAIRAMGRGVFKLFTRTPNEEIVTIANVNNQGPNEDRELNAVIGWLKKNATDMGDADIDFSQVMPGYRPRVREFSTAKTRFHVVMDDFGKYIYAYPEKDAVNIEPTKALGQSDDFSGEVERDEYGAPIKRIQEANTMKRESISESIRYFTNLLDDLAKPTDWELNKEIFESLGIEIDEANIRKVRDPETKRMTWKSTEEAPYSSLEQEIGDAPGGKQLVKFLHRNKNFWRLDADASWGSAPLRNNSAIDITWRQVKNHPDKFLIIVGDEGVAAVKPSESYINQMKKTYKEKRKEYNPEFDNRVPYQVKAFTANGMVPDERIVNAGDEENAMTIRIRGGLPSGKDFGNETNIFDRLRPVIGRHVKIIFAEEGVPRSKISARAERGPVDKSGKLIGKSKPVKVEQVMTKLIPVFVKLVQQMLGRIGPMIGRLSQAGNFSQAANLTKSGERLQNLLTALDADQVDWFTTRQNSPIMYFRKIVMKSIQESTQDMDDDQKNDFLNAVTSAKSEQLDVLLTHIRNNLQKLYSID